MSTETLDERLGATKSKNKTMSFLKEFRYAIFPLTFYIPLFFIKGKKRRQTIINRAYKTGFWVMPFILPVLPYLMLVFAVNHLLMMFYVAADPSFDSGWKWVSHDSNRLANNNSSKTHTSNYHINKTNNDYRYSPANSFLSQNIYHHRHRR